MIALSALLVWMAPAFAGSSAFPAAATVKTADGLTLQATYGQPAKPSVNGAVFVHMNGRSKEDWALVAEDCWRAGAYVITVDLRGMGSNVAKGATPVPPTPEDYLKMVEDVKAAVAFLRAKGVTHVTLVGAELGANLAINVAADDPAVVDVVLLSPGMTYKGVIATDAVKRYGPRAFYMAASQDDAYGFQSLTRLADLATGPKKVEVFDTAGKGTMMLNREPELQGNVVGWIGTHWTVAAVVEPKAPTTIVVKPSEGTLETTGPTGSPLPK